MTTETQLLRQNGVALWRQLADSIRAAISRGDYDVSGMVPPETVLAAEFGVNRHTVRSALAALGQEGLVRSMRGRGTLIEPRERLNFPISRRTRFSEGIGEQARDLEGVLLSFDEEAANDGIADRLDLAPGTPVIRLETLHKANQRPVSRSSSWFPAARFCGIGEAFAETGSITAAYRALGLADYVRVTTEITAIPAGPGDCADLQLSPSAILLVSKALNADPEGCLIQFSVSRFAADAVQFTITN